MVGWLKLPVMFTHRLGIYDLIYSNPSDYECWCVLSRMHSEGFSLNSGGLEVGVVLAERCRGVRKRPQHVRNEAAKPHHWAALAKCDQDDVLDVDFLAHSVFLLRFVACVDSSVRVLRGRHNILKGVTVAASFSPGKRSMEQHFVLVHFTISRQAQHF